MSTKQLHAKVLAQYGGVMSPQVYTWSALFTWCSFTHYTLQHLLTPPAAGAELHTIGKCQMETGLFKFAVPGNNH